MRPAIDQEVVETSWGDVLTANLPYNSRGESVPHEGWSDFMGKMIEGDMIACADAGGYPNENDSWVVNGAVFANTYVPAY